MPRETISKEEQYTYILDAMRLVVAWDDMETFCQSRSTCKGCPYASGKACDRMSTQSVLEKAAEMFRFFLHS